MAVADAGRCIKNAPYRIDYYSYNVTDGALNTGDAANMDAEVSIDDAAPVNCSGTETEVGNGHYFVEISAAQNTGSSIVVVVKTATANMFQPFIPVHHRHEPCVDSGVAQASAANTLVLRSAASFANDDLNGCDVEIVRGTCAGQVRRIVDYIGASDTALVDREWIGGPPDTTSVYIVKGNSGPALNTFLDANADVHCAGGFTSNRTDFGNSLFYGATANLPSFVNGGTPSTTSFVTGLPSSVTDAYKDSVLTFALGSSLQGESAKITAYNGSTKVVTVSPAFSAAPVDQDPFIVSGLFI